MPSPARTRAGYHAIKRDVVNPAAGLQQGPTAVRPTWRLIQVLRAAAALMVVLHHETLALWDRLHLGPPHYNWINGGAGVDIFFVISGFVMMISSAPLRDANRPTAHPARTFLARRVERVVPLYWLLTTVKILLVLLAPAAAVNGLGSPWHVVASYLFIPAPNWQGALEPVLVVGWTLNFEMLFYALFAVSLALCVHPLKLVAPVLAAMVLLRTIGTHEPAVLFWYSNSIVLEFIFGMLLALCLPYVKRVPPLPALLAGAAAALPLLLWVAPNFSPWRGVGWGLPALVIVGSAIALEARLGPTAPRWMLELGDASYSIYLVHGFVIPLFAEALAHLGTTWPGVVPVSLIAMLVLATLSGEAVYRAIELPLMRLFKARRRTAVPANA